MEILNNSIGTFLLNCANNSRPELMSLTMLVCLTCNVTANDNAMSIISNCVLQEWFKLSCYYHISEKSPLDIKIGCYIDKVTVLNHKSRCYYDCGRGQNCSMNISGFGIWQINAWIIWIYSIYRTYRKWVSIVKFITTVQLIIDITWTLLVNKYINSWAVVCSTYRIHGSS